VYHRSAYLLIRIEANSAGRTADSWPYPGGTVSWDLSQMLVNCPGIQRVQISPCKSARVS